MAIRKDAKKAKHIIVLFSITYHLHLNKFRLLVSLLAGPIDQASKPTTPVNECVWLKFSGFILRDGNFNISVNSSGHVAESRPNGYAIIKINGKDHSKNLRGFNFVVIDGESGKNNSNILNFWIRFIPLFYFEFSQLLDFIWFKWGWRCYSCRTKRSFESKVNIPEYHSKLWSMGKC